MDSCVSSGWPVPCRLSGGWQTRWYKMAIQWHFSLCFSDYRQDWLPSPMLTGHLCFLICKLPNHTFSSFSHFVVVFFSLTEGPCCLEPSTAHFCSLIGWLLLISLVTTGWNVPGLSHSSLTDLIQSYIPNTILYTHYNKFHVAGMVFFTELQGYLSNSLLDIL